MDIGSDNTTKKVVINESSSSFSVSPLVAIELYKLEKGVDVVYLYILSDDDVEEIQKRKYVKLKVCGTESRDVFSLVDYKMFQYGIVGAYISNSDLGDCLNQSDIEDLNLDSLSVYSAKISREDNSLINLIETYGSEYCSGRFCKLKIVEIPYDVEYTIGTRQYSGNECIIEKHRTWY